MPDDLVPVYSTYSEADALATFAALNAEDIPAQVFDTSHSWLRWQIEAISPRQIVVPSSSAEKATRLIQRWGRDRDQVGPQRSTPRRPRSRAFRLWRSTCFALLWAVLIFCVGRMLIPVFEGNWRMLVWW